MSERSGQPEYRKGSHVIRTWRLHMGLLFCAATYGFCSGAQRKDADATPSAQPFAVGDDGGSGWVALLNACFTTRDDAAMPAALRRFSYPGTTAFTQRPDLPEIRNLEMHGLYSWTPFLTGEDLQKLSRSVRAWFVYQSDGSTPDRRSETAPAGALPFLVDARAASPFLAPGAAPQAGSTLPGLWRATTPGPGRQSWADGTCVAVLMACDLILRVRDPVERDWYRPRLRAALNWIASMSDSRTGLIRGGEELTAPYTGAGITSSINIHYAAALAAAAEVERWAGNSPAAGLLQRRRARLVGAFRKNLVESPGYFVKNVDGERRHGVYGASLHGYVETVPNVDAVAWHVIDAQRSRRPMGFLSGIAGLRPTAWTPTNFPGRDEADRFPLQDAQGAPGHGMNGGAWGTFEARSVLAYYRVEDYARAYGSARLALDILSRPTPGRFATDYGRTNAVAAGEDSGINIDFLGVTGAALRGLMEYVYEANTLKLVPHLPPTLLRYRQNAPVGWGQKQITLSVEGIGPITRVLVNGKPWKHRDERSITLDYGALPEHAEVRISLGTVLPISGSSKSFLEIHGVRLLREHRIFRNVGANLPDLFERFLNGDAEGARHALQEARKAGIRCVRCQGTTGGPGQFALFGRERTRWLRAFEQMLAAADAEGIAIVPSLLFNIRMIPEYVTRTSGKTEGVVDLLTPGTASNSLAMEYITAIVSRFKDDPRVLFWEIGNEYNLEADLSSQERPRPRREIPTSDQIRLFLIQAASRIHSLDRHHAVTSGNADMRPAAWHLRQAMLAHRRDPDPANYAVDWTQDTFTQYTEMLRFFSPSPLDILSIHQYPPERETPRWLIPDDKRAFVIPWSRLAADQIGQPLFVGAFGARFVTDNQEQEAPWLRDFLLRMETGVAPLAMLWAWDFQPERPDQAAFAVSPTHTPRMVQAVTDTNLAILVESLQEFAP